MQKHTISYIPVTLDGLNKKLDFEVKRLIREKEDGIARYVSRTTKLNGISTLVFTKTDGKKIKLFYRLDSGGALRFAREKQFAILPATRKPASAQIGQES
jgi:hypothetical protein